MRIKSITIKDFGRFHNFEALRELNPGLVLLYGSNEAGKTTIFHLLKTLLYGFSPAKLEQHPYTPWNRERMEFSATLVDSHCNEGAVHRRLLSSPKGTFVQGEGVLELRNQPIPLANHIAPEIYERIYALTLEELVEIQGKAWEQVQDKLLANYGSYPIRSPKVVLRELQEEIHQLQRPSGRGKSVLKELDASLAALKQEALAARQRQEQLFTYQVQLQALEEKLIQGEEARVRLKAQGKQLAAALPLQELLEEKGRLEEGLINLPCHQQLPKDLLEKLTQGDRELERLEQQLRDKEEKIQGLIQQLTPLDEREVQILQEETQIRNLYRESLSLEVQKKAIDKLEQEIHQLKEQRQYEEGKIFSRKLEPEELEALMTLDMAKVNVLVSNYRQLNTRLQELKRLHREEKGRRAKEKGGKGSIPYLVMGVALLLLAIFQRNWVLLPGATLVLGYSLWMGFTGGSTGSEGHQQIKHEITDLEENHREAWEALLAPLKRLPLDPVVIDHLGAQLIATLGSIRDTQFAIQQRGVQADQEKQEYHDKLAPIHQLITTLQGQAPVHPLEAMGALFQEMEGLKLQLIRDQSLREQLEGIQEQHRDLERQWKTLQGQLEIWRQGLKELGDQELEQGILRYEENEQRLMALKMVEEKLLGFGPYGPLLKGLEEIPYPLSQEGLEEIQSRLEAMEAELQQLRDEKKELQLQMKILLEQITLDEVESQILLLQEQREAAVIKRDRLQLLSGIIKAGEESFREANQPDVLKNASHYLKLMTGGRYTQIYLEEEGGVAKLWVRAQGCSAPLEVKESFSKGTLNQIYLSLRLSLIDHLDRNGEPLPIALDELLINFDQERLDHSLALLKEISQKRQVFLFTCHSWMVEAVQRHFQVAPILLAPAPLGAAEQE